MKRKLFKLFGRVENPGTTPRFLNSWFSVLSISCTLLFSSCSTDQTEDWEGAPSPVSPSLISLMPDPEQPIIIDDLTEVLPQAVEGRATSSAGVDRGRFNIDLKFLLPPTERQLEVFESAAARWERIIIKDKPSFTGTLPSSFAGFPPAVDGTLDDIVIEVALAPIDGPGGVLGRAGPRFVRTSDFLTLSGVMFFDVADLATLEFFGLFEDVIVHEMGHVLGIGTLWNVNVPALGIERNLRQGPVSNPYFSGQMANVFWNAEGGTEELPVENIGGPGTALGHWRESALNNELMTGFLNLGENPLSRITAGSMKDLGYGAAVVGEQYDLVKGTLGVDPDNTTLGMGEEGLNIAAMEEILQPIGFVTSKE